MKANILASILLAGAISALGVTPPANYVVSAQANIYGAGLAAPVAPGGYGAGGLPVFHSLALGDSGYKFSAAGTISEFPGLSHNADGRSYTVDIYAAGGISGFRSDRILPLVGVFLDDNAPGAPAPATLQFTASGLGFNFTTLSPALGQVFYIGDGKTASNQDQLFFAPAGATRLFLGFADAPYSTGAPGAYADNSGQLNVTVTPVPEPGSIALCIIGASLILVGRKRGGQSEIRR